MIKQSNFNIDQEHFNNYPGFGTIAEDLAFLNGEVKLIATPVDLDSNEISYWENDHATLVLEIDANQLTYWKLLQRAWRADEFHTKHIDGKTIIRLWWD